MLENKFNEDFDRWEINFKVDDIYDIDYIGYADEGFLVILIPDHFIEQKKSNRKLKLIWDSIISYTVTDESYRPELWGDGTGNATDNAYSFFISKDSDYLRKIKQENYLIDEKAIHFLIAGTNLNADILSDDYPNINYLN